MKHSRFPALAAAAVPLVLAAPAVAAFTGVKTVSKPNAFGIPEPELRALLESENELSLILKYAVSYGALAAARGYGQGGKDWCLLELTGPVCLRFGLTLKRGGFIESNTDYLAGLVGSG